MQIGVYFEQEIKPNLYHDPACSLQQVLGSCINIYISLVVMVDHERKQCHFRLKAICGPKSEYLREGFDFAYNSPINCRRMFKSIQLLRIGLSRQFCSAKLLQIGKIYFNNKILFWKVAKNRKIMALLSIEHFSLAPLC